MRRLWLLALAGLAPALAAPGAAQAAPDLIVGTIGIPPGSGWTAFSAPDGAHGTVSPLAGAGGAAVAADGHTAWIVTAALASAQVASVNLATSTPGPAVPLPGTQPEDVAIAPDGATMYVTNGIGDSVIPIAMDTLAVGAAIPVGDAPRGIVISPDGRRLYVANSGTPSGVTVVDPTGAVASVTLTGAAFDRTETLAVTPDGKTVYAGNFGTTSSGTTVVPIDTATNAAGTPITVGTTVMGLAVDPVLPRLYAAARDSHLIAIVDTGSNTVTGSFALAATDLPLRLAVSPAGDRLYFTEPAPQPTGGRLVTLALPGGAAVGSPIPMNGAFSIAAAPVVSGGAASFTFGGTLVAGRPVTFDGTASTGSVSWAFGDGATAQGSTAEHVFAAAGTYEVTLTSASAACAAGAVFRAPGGLWAGKQAFCTMPPTATKTVTIEPVPAPPPPPPPPPAPTPAPVPAPAPAPTQPSAVKRCTSLRFFSLRLPSGTKVRRISATVDGKRATVLRGARVRVRVNLRGTPKKTVLVKVSYTTTSGKQRTIVRRYKTCTTKGT